MRESKEISWEEIYYYWQFYSIHGPSILNRPISLTKRYIDFSDMEEISFFAYI